MKPDLEILNRIADTVLAYRPKPMDEFEHVINQGSEIYVDSREIAKLFGVQHDNFMQLVDKNAEPLTSLGQLLFETGVGKKRPQGGGNPQKFAWLNFDQIAFLLTLSRTTAVTREYRLRLIVMFRNERAKQLPINAILLSIPEIWKKTFPDEFYIALLRVYGDVFKPNKNKPSWVGRWTTNFIYDPIVAGLTDELKAKRRQYSTDSGKDADYLRLHQFLVENAKDQLRDRISKLTGFLQASRGIQEFKEFMVAWGGGGTQQRWDEFDEIS